MPGERLELRIAAEDGRTTTLVLGAEDAAAAIAALRDGELNEGS